MTVNNYKLNQADGSFSTPTILSLKLRRKNDIITNQNLLFIPNEAGSFLLENG